MVGKRRYGENDVERQAAIRRELLVRDGASLTGVSMVTGLLPGRTFEVSGHPTPGLDGEYLVTRVVHASTAPPGVEGHGGEEYHNLFECLPVETPWRPERRTPKPAIYGVQTAVVTGGNPGEIHTDEYGRIQVLFHWDREGAEPTSCWIRVGQVWAGHDGMGYPGFVFIPRVGMEVIVTFVDGDPDRPLVTGAVYNGTNLPPESLPDEASRSMIRTRSLGGDGYNELSFEDASGNEEVHLRAERNLRELVQYNHDTRVMNDQTNVVDANQTEEIGENQEMTVHGNRTKTVDKDEKNTVTQNRITEVTIDETLHVGGTRAITVDGDDTLDVTGSESVHVIGSTQHTLDDGWSITVANGVEQTIESGGWTMTTTGDVAHEVIGTIKLTATGKSKHSVGLGYELSAQQITLSSRSAVRVSAPQGIQDITPATRQTLGQEIVEYVSDRTSYGSMKLSGYIAATSLYGFTTSIAGVKVDNSGLKIATVGLEVGTKVAKLDTIKTINLHKSPITIIG